MGHTANPGFALSSTNSLGCRHHTGQLSSAFLSLSTFLYSSCDPTVFENFYPSNAALPPLSARNSKGFPWAGIIPADLRLAFKLSVKCFFGRPLGLVLCWSSEQHRNFGFSGPACGLDGQTREAGLGESLLQCLSCCNDWTLECLKLWNSVHKERTCFMAFILGYSWCKQFDVQLYVYKSRTGQKFSH